jgi:hypothetical protein
MNVGYIEDKISAAVMGTQCDYHLALTRVNQTKVQKEKE